jgi:hypothetical protein
MSKAAFTMEEACAGVAKKNADVEWVWESFLCSPQKFAEPVIAVYFLEIMPKDEAHL